VYCNVLKRFCKFSTADIENNRKILLDELLTIWIRLEINIVCIYADIRKPRHII